MTVENANTVDGIGFSKIDGKVVLTISDHLSWADENTHFDHFEKKIGGYLNFINSGQIFEVFPHSKKCAVRIELMYQYQPTENALIFLSAAKKQLQLLDIELTYNELPEATGCRLV